ncbi:hypothetical protein MYX76_01760 [Desulfobacterota bacterium AH_259_B03_O07]|nr:hypothetical protein [Desulfobacterota bacterium AH_259_B03_O07]
MKDTYGYSSPEKVTSERDIRVEFVAMLEGKKVCFPGNRRLEGKLLLTGAYYFYIVGTEEVNA